MTHHFSRVALLATALAAAAACAQASVVTVTPENMQGWSIETNQGATAALANYGYAVAQRPVGESPTAPGPWTAEDGVGLGQGAYYATLKPGTYDGSGRTPSTAWLGLDMFNGQSLAGVALSRITKLEYYALNAHFPTLSIASDWNSWTYWSYSRQPIQLQITAQSPDGSDRRQFWFLPWEPVGWDPNRGSWLRGDKCGQHANKWLRYDCINFNYPGSGMGGYWYCPKIEVAFQSWADLIAQFGSYTLVPTSNDPYPTGWKSAGWDDLTDPVGDPLCTATGKCINFEVGARSGNLVHVYFADDLGWVNDFQGLRGYVDRFSLGIDGNIVTYNFEPSATAKPPRVVCMSIKASYDPIINVLNDNEPGRTMVKIIGKVASRGNPRFWMGDPFTGTIDPLAPQIVTYTFEGDPMKGLQHLWPNPTYIDDYWSVTGILERPIIEQNDNMWPMWTNYQGMQLFYY